MKLSYTRAMIRAALSGDFESISFHTHEIFGLAIPHKCPNVPDEILNPRNTWENKSQYDEKATALAKSFEENYRKF